QAVAPSLRVELVPLNLRDASGIERSVAAFVRSSSDGLIVTSGPLAAVHRHLIVNAAARHKLPAGYFSRFIAGGGGAVSLWGRILSTNIGLRPATPTASLGARSQAICRCRRRPSTSWSSTSRPRRPSASTYRPPCSLAPTR